MNTFDKLKQVVAIITLVTTVHSKAIAENFSLDNTQDHITIVSENNTDSIITAMVRTIVDEQSQLEQDLQEIETKISILKKSAQTMINNEENFTTTFSEEQRAQIETVKDVTAETLQLLEEGKVIKEKIITLEQEADKFLKKLEDAATFRYLNPSPESKD